VAVFFPERADWDDFRRGVLACARKGLVRVTSEQLDAVVVETSGRRRALRFDWHRARGGLESRGEVQRLLALAEPPIAIVGSSNTALTADLAAELNAARPEAGGPLLLVPWATSIDTLPPTEGGRGHRSPLLGVYPGRTFRFCLDNHRQAGLV